LENEDFRKVEDSYIRPFLTKGVPSLFSYLHPLYDHPGKVDILEELILEIEASLQNNGGFSGKS
jgi:peptide alpha-N-acetyltransferase